MFPKNFNVFQLISQKLTDLADPHQKKYAAQAQNEENRALVAEAQAQNIRNIGRWSIISAGVCLIARKRGKPKDCAKRSAFLLWNLGKMKVSI